METVNEEVALRLALAARALPDMDVKELVSVVISLIGHPIIISKLNKIRLHKLKNHPDLIEMDESYLSKALGFLRGKNIQTEPEELPETCSYDFSLANQSILVAIASNSAERINGHFGSCSHYLIYQVSPFQSRLVDIRKPYPISDTEDKNLIRSKLISDCTMLYTLSIGGPAAAKVVKSGIHPIKLPQGGSMSEVLNKLQMTLSKSPPPWLAKALSHQNHLRHEEEQ